MRKIIIIFFLPLILADPIPECSLNPKRDITKYLKSITQDMVKQISGGANDTKSRDKPPIKQQAAESYTSIISSKKLVYTVGMNFDIQAGEKKLIEDYSWFLMKGNDVKLDVNFSYYFNQSETPCSSSFTTRYNDIDSLIVELDKHAFNGNFNKINSTIISSSASLNWDTPTCVNIPEEIQNDIMVQMNLKIVSRTLERLSQILLAKLVTPNNDANNGESYAYFIPYDNSHIMIRGLNRLRKTIIQYPDEGMMVPGVSKFNIPIWDAKISWFRYNVDKAPLHLCLKTEYLFLQGTFIEPQQMENNSNTIRLKFNVPDFVLLNGHPKKFDVQIAKELDNLKNQATDCINVMPQNPRSIMQYDITTSIIKSFNYIIHQFQDNGASPIINADWGQKTVWSMNRFLFKEINLISAPQSHLYNYVKCQMDDSKSITVGGFYYETITANGVDTDVSNLNVPESLEKLLPNNSKFFLHQINTNGTEITLYQKLKNDNTDYDANFVHNDVLIMITSNNKRQITPRTNRTYIMEIVLKEFESVIKNIITNKIKDPIKAIRETCNEPLQNFTKWYPDFSNNSHHDYYLAIDNGIVDIDDLNMTLLDIMIIGLTDIRFIHVHHLSENCTGYEINTRNLEGTMMMVKREEYPVELNFNIGDFSLIINSTSRSITNVTVKTTQFNIASTKAQSDLNTIQEKFEKTVQKFFHELLLAAEGEELENPQKNLPPRNESVPSQNKNLEQGRPFLNDKYNITDDVSRIIATILKDFQSNVVQNMTKNIDTPLKDGNFFKDDVNITDVMILSSILGIQEEICTFEDTFKVIYEDIYVRLNGTIKPQNMDTFVPFIMHIFTIDMSRDAYSAKFKINTNFSNDMIFLNTTNLDIDPERKASMKTQISEHLKTKIEDNIINQTLFNDIYNICKKPIGNLGNNKFAYDADPENYYFIMYGNEVNFNFHTPLQVNFIAIWGLSKFHSIKIRKIATSTEFEFLALNLAARMNWTYYTNDSFNQSEEMDMHAGFLRLCGKIDKYKNLTWSDSSRIIFNITILPPSKKKTITVERIKNKVNETMLTHIKHLIEQHFNASLKKDRT